MWIQKNLQNRRQQHPEQKPPLQQQKKAARVKKTTASNTFTIAIEADTGNTLNPFTSTDRYGLMTNNMLFAPLARMNTDGSIDYVIADSIETSEDGLVYTVKIKETSNGAMANH